MDCVCVCVCLGCDGVSLRDVVCLYIALRNKDDSCLLRHELAYILGQIQDNAACGVLSDILQDTSDDVMVRHEVRSFLHAYIPQ